MEIDKLRDKQEVYWSVLNAAISLDFRKGHQRWTISELSRQSKITRSLIYYYFGKSRTSILNEAVVLIGEEVMGLNPSRLKLWSEGKILESVLSSRSILDKSTHLAAFYMATRLKENEIGEAIRKLENQYMKKISQFFPGVKDGDVKATFGLFFGLVFAPYQTEESIRRAVEAAVRIVK